MTMPSGHVSDEVALSLSLGNFAPPAPPEGESGVDRTVTTELVTNLALDLLRERRALRAIADGDGLEEYPASAAILRLDDEVAELRYRLVAAERERDMARARAAGLTRRCAANEESAAVQEFIAATENLANLLSAVLARPSSAEPTRTAEE